MEKQNTNQLPPTKIEGGKETFGNATWVWTK